MAEEATKTEKRSYTLEDLEGRTPDEISDLIDVTKAQIRSLHQTETGELRHLSDSETKAMEILLKVHERALEMHEEHRRINDVLRTKPNAIEYSRLGGTRDDPYSDVRRLSISEARDRALRVLDNRQSAAHLRSDEKDEVERQIRTSTDIARRILVTENDDYRNAFLKMVTKPNAIMYLTDDERRALVSFDEYRTMAEGAAGTGGAGVPVKLAA